jgi:hypothetical protein
VQPGVIYLAARTGLPIQPMGLGVRRCWRANSWDQFCVPKAFTMATAVWGEPFRVPKEAAREGQEQYRFQLEKTLHRVTSLAEAWANSGESIVA